MNNVMAVDSSGAVLSICLKKGDSWFELNISDGLKHSESLMDSIVTLLRKADLSKEDLELLVCCEGPGSFTGLRIGMSTVKGLSYGLGIPHTAVTSTDVLASGFFNYPGVVVPVIDARKKRFYCAVYDSGRQLSPPRDLSQDEIFELLKDCKRVLFTGPDCGMIDTSHKENYFIDSEGNSGTGLRLLKLGIIRFEKEGPLPEDYGPLYLRKSEAEIALYGEKR